MSEMMSDEQIEQSGILETIFGDALPKVRAFYEKLKSEGEPRGLIGPRDVDILWERHLLNSAAVVPFIRQATNGKQFRSVADIGSGGGFPGLVAAAMLPDHTFTLIEPMERRCEWLSECVETMGLENVQIVRARSEEAIAALEQARGKSSGRGHAKNTVTPEVAQAIRHPFTVVTCRAVAPMTKLTGWTLPLVAPHGELIALKGRSAGAEIEKARKVIAQYGGRHARVKEAEVAPGLEPTHVLIVDKQ